MANPFELVDVVDSHNKVIAQATKQAAHKQGLLHRTVVAMIRDTQGNYVLVKQSAGRQDPGQYVSPVGGHVKAGETEIDALKRETQEEAGLTDFKSKRLGQAIFDREVNGHQENHFFIFFEIYSDAELVLNHESVSYHRFSQSDLKNELKHHPDSFGAAFHFVWEKFY
jgi:isopentenyl-diphosphate Delta-isomerase